MKRHHFEAMYYPLAFLTLSASWLRPPQSPTTMMLSASPWAETRVKQVWTENAKDVSGNLSLLNCFTCHETDSIAPITEKTHPARFQQKPLDRKQDQLWSNTKHGGIKETQETVPARKSRKTWHLGVRRHSGRVTGHGAELGKSK